jgi:hypothetical protein
MRKLVSMRAALGDDELLGKALKGDSWRSCSPRRVAHCRELVEHRRNIERKSSGLLRRRRENRVRALATKEPNAHDG